MKRSIPFLVFLLTFWGIGLTGSSPMADDRRSDNVNVSFGQWDPNNPNLMPTVPGEVPLDRLVADPAMGRGNNHAMFPKVAKIEPCDSVSFIISGGHVISIYDGKRPDDIGPEIEPICPSTGPITSPCSPANAAGVPQAGGILSDSDGRIYRGPTFTGRRDGVEVVQFSKPGTYLVICARKAHFEDDGMFGFVVVREDDKHRSW